MTAGYERGGRSTVAADLHAERVAADRKAAGRRHAEQTANLKPGDRVTVRGGNPGTVEARDGDRVTVRFDVPRDIGWPRLPLVRETVPVSVVSLAGGDQ